MKKISAFNVRFTRAHNSTRKTARIILPKKVEDRAKCGAFYLLKPGVKERQKNVGVSVIRREGARD